MADMNTFLDEMSDDLGEGDVKSLLAERDAKSNGPNLFKQKEFEPVYKTKEDVDNTHSPVKTFTVLVYPEITKLPDGVIKSLSQYIAFLSSKNYRYRHTAIDSREPKNSNILLSAAGDNVSGIYAGFKNAVPEGFTNSCKHTLESLGLCAGIHPKFSALPDSVRFDWDAKIQALIGTDLNCAVDLLVIYTFCGNTHFNPDDKKLKTTFGHIGYYVQYAESMGIPIFNIKSPNANEQIKKFVEMHKTQQAVNIDDF